MTGFLWAFPPILRICSSREVKNRALDTSLVALRWTMERLDRILAGIPWPSVRFSTPVSWRRAYLPDKCFGQSGSRFPEKVYPGERSNLEILGVDEAFRRLKLGCRKRSRRPCASDMIESRIFWDRDYLLDDRGNYLKVVGGPILDNAGHQLYSIFLPHASRRIRELPYGYSSFPKSFVVLKDDPGRVVSPAQGGIITALGLASVKSFLARETGRKSLAERVLLSWLSYRIDSGPVASGYRRERWFAILGSPVRLIDGYTRALGYRSGLLRHGSGGEGPAFLFAHPRLGHMKGPMRWRCTSGG